jgi:hypothetical protein
MKALDVDLEAIRIKAAFFAEIQVIEQPFNKIAMLVARDIFSPVKP